MLLRGYVSVVAMRDGIRVFQLDLIEPLCRSTSP